MGLFDIFSGKSAVRNVSDALPYQELYSDGTILTKDLGLLKCWHVMYKDVTLNNLEADEAAEGIARMFNRRTDGQAEVPASYWFIIQRLPLKLLFEPEYTGEDNMVGGDYEIEKHRQKLFSNPDDNLINTFYACCKIGVSFGENGIAEASMRKANEAYAEFESAMRTIGATMEPLTCTAQLPENNIMSFLKLSCGTELKPFKCPEKGMADISSFISTKVIEKGKPMLLGDSLVQMMTLNDFPTETYSCMLAKLLALPFAFKWSTRWIPYSNKESQNKATKLRNSFKSAQKSWKSAMYEASTGKESQNINTQAVTDANAVEEVLVNLSKGETLGMMTSTVCVMDENMDRLKDKTARVHEALASSGFDAIEESPMSNFDAWKASLPGDSASGRRRALCTASNLSCIVPFTSLFHGSSTDFYLKRLTGLGAPHMMGRLPTQEVFYLNLNGPTDDIGHTFIIGATGGGKSVFLGLMGSQWARYPGSRVILFDKDMSFKNICERTGGAIYNPAADDSPLKFMPLGRLKTKPSEALEWLEVAIDSAGVTVTPEITKQLRNIIEDWDDSPATVTRFVNKLRGSYPDSPALSALEKYVGDGPLATLFGGEDDSFNNKSFGQKTMIEMGSLMNMGNSAVYPALQFIFARIDELFDTDPKPTLLVMDEAWLFINHKIFRLKIKEWLKTLRKKRVFVVMAVQNINDVDDPEEFLTSCYTRIYLANPELRGEGTPSIKEAYRRIGITESEMEIIGNARRKRDYFIQQKDGSALVNFLVDGYQLERIARDGQ